MSEGEEANSLDKLDTFELDNGMECVPDGEEAGKLHCEDPDTGELHQIDADDVEL